MSSKHTTLCVVFCYFPDHTKRSIYVDSREATRASPSHVDARIVSRKGVEEGRTKGRTGTGTRRGCPADSDDNVAKRPTATREITGEVETR